MTGRARREGVGWIDVLALLALGCCVLLLGIRFVLMREPVQGQRPLFLDFEDFHLVGRMALHGQIAAAYARATMWPPQVAEGAVIYLPWTYPPQFDLMVGGLALLPKAWAYVGFTALSLAGYLWVLGRIAGRHWTLVALAMIPAIMICVDCGQNGFLTATLAGLFALASLAGRNVAGLPLGLMVVKPHLALGLGVLALAERRWRIVGIATAVVLASGVLATFAFGLGIWPAFLSGVAEAAEWMRGHIYPFYRMTSLYSVLYPAGLTAGLALALQGAVAIMACGAIIWTVRRNFAAEVRLGVAMLASLAFTPYVYDYDMPMLGVALALLAPRILACAGWAELVLIWLLTWVTGGSGVVLSIILSMRDSKPDPLPDVYLGSVAGLSYLVLFVVLLRVLRRALAVPE